MIPTLAMTKGAAVCIGRPCIIVAARDRPQTANGRPRTSPAMTVTSESRSTSHVTSPAVAPSATRMPISFVRRATV